MDRGAWWATVHGVAKSQTRLSDFYTFHVPLLLDSFVIGSLIDSNIFLELLLCVQTVKVIISEMSVKER